MTPERWQRIEQVYYAALECAEEQRLAYLAEACATDESLRHSVEQLLIANQQAGSFLVSPAFEKEAQAISSTAPSLTIGQQFSHYRILTQLGIGGMGEVWLAEDISLGRKVALKLLPLQFTADHGRLQRFIREAKTASALNHPNIITIYEIGEAPSQSGPLRFIATEYIEGITLRQRLINGRMEFAEVLQVIRQIGSALEAAHKVGIVHRDLKPENIMLRPDGLVKVLDFGLARIADAPPIGMPLEIKTDTGMIMGTPRYMSPEQARGKDLDARTDIFSLGVILYEMLAGQSPFAGETTAEVFAALLDKEPELLGKVVPDLPAPLEQIVNRALQKDRTNRYQTSHEMMQDFEQSQEQWHSLGRTIALPARIVTNETARGTNESAVVPSVKAGALTRRKKGLIWGAVALAIGLGGVSLLLPRLTSWSRMLSGPPMAVPFATYTGMKDHASFSPDGSQIAFAWDGGKPRVEGKRDIYIKLVGVGEPVQMTFAPEDEARPAWSPDNKYIAFLRRDALYLIPSLPGGTERRLIESINSFSWSLDSKTLVVATQWKKEAPGNLWLISAETGERLKALTQPSQPSSDDQPAVSPDGKQLAFFRSFGPTRREVFVMPASGGEPKQLTTDKRQIEGLTWTGNSREIVYASNRGSGMALWRISANGGTPERITVPGFYPVAPSISRQGNQLAYTDRYHDANIYKYEGNGFVGRATPGKFGEPVSYLSSTRDDHSQQISPDGEKIAFVSMRSGSEEVWVCKRDGTGLIQLTSINGYPTGSPSWSPDSRWIAFDTRVDGNAEVYVVSADGGPSRNFTNFSSFEVVPSWSHDGKWIYFSSNRGGSYEIWRQPVEGGAAVQITHTGAGSGLESPDGKLVYFSKGGATYGLWSVPVAGGDEAPVPELNRAGYTRSWGIVGQGIYFISKEDTPRQTIKFFSFATRRITPLVTVEKEALFYQSGLTLAPDGRTLLYAQKDHSVNDILLIENFR